MKVSPRYHTDPHGLELELTMRDVLAGMEEILSGEALGFEDCGLEILAIEPPEASAAPALDTPEQTEGARILPFRRSA